MTGVASRLLQRVSRERRRVAFCARHEWGRRPPYSLRYQGFEMQYSRGDTLVHVFSINGSYEPKVLAKLPALLRPGAVVIDVGANIGFFSLAVLGTVPESSVHMFEPSPGPRRNLAGTIARNGLHDRARLTGAAIYAQPGEMTFIVHPEQFAAYDGFRDTNYLGVGHTCAIKVPVMTIDSYVADVGVSRLDLLKVDVEGAELFAFQGAERTLSELRPVLLFEVGYQNLAPYDLLPGDLYEHLEQSGYSVHDLQDHALSKTQFSHRCVSEHEFLAYPIERHPGGRARDSVEADSVRPTGEPAGS